MVDKEIEKARAALKPKTEPRFKKTDFLSLGHSILNLGCSGHVEGAILPGMYVFFVGDSDSGKSYLSTTLFAEANLSEFYKDYKLIHDPVERCLLDFGKVYGVQTAKRIIAPPNGVSQHVEGFYSNVKAAIADGPCIYVLDAQDALPPAAALKEVKKKPTGEDKGSYGTEKAKIHANAKNLAKVCSELTKNGSILLIVNQTRDNIGFGSQFNPKVYSGGTALKYYAKIQLWSSMAGKIRRKIKGKDRHLGNLCKIQVRKNHISGQDATVFVPITRRNGIDDIGSCIHYLVEEGVFQLRKKEDDERNSKVDYGKFLNSKISAPELDDFEGTVDELAQNIQEFGLEQKLRRLVQKRFNEVEEAMTLKRKSKYQ